MDKDTHHIVNVLDEFGNFLKGFLFQAENEGTNYSQKLFSDLDYAINRTEKENPWFTRQFQLINLSSWSQMLEKEKITKWIGNYPDLRERGHEPKKVGLVLAGNIPLVGLHDIICVLATGNIAITKLSSKDRIIYPEIKKILTEIDPSFAEKWILLEESPLKDMDAVIATGSNNSARYFEYYFGKYPSIIRKNRNSVAILEGNETPEQMKALADDIFLYFGLGCRNVSKIFVSEDFKPDQLYENIEHYSWLSLHNKYANNYDYQRAILLVNRIRFFDNGFLVLKEDPSLYSPVGSVYFSTYSSLEEIKLRIENDRDKIQCVITGNEIFPGRVSFGRSQFPALNDYADNIDTMNFLINLSKN